MPSELRPARPLASACLLLLLSSCGAVEYSSPTPSRQAQLAPTASATPAAGSSALPATLVPMPAPTGTPAPAPATSFGGGLLMVGTAIQPGTYESSDPSGGGELGGLDVCYWERLAGLSGDVGDIIASDLSDGRAVVTIAPGDLAFNSLGCGTWTQLPRLE